MQQLLEAIYNYNATELQESYKEGYNTIFFSPDWSIQDNALLTAVQNNIFAFSGAKTYSQMKELGNAVYDNNGALRSRGDFNRIAKKINRKYNIHYLDAERQNVINSATQASRWVDIEQTKETHPYLRYCTAKDELVREEHRLLEGITLPIDDQFWDSYYPPNGWRCRCYVQRISEREYSRINKKDLVDSEQAQKIAGKVVAKPFRQNVAKQKVIFKDNLPYYENIPGGKQTQLSAVKHYNMPSVEKIYTYPNRLSKYKGEITNQQSYNDWWGAMEDKYGTKGNGFTLIDKKRDISAQFDIDLKQKLINKDRYNYFDEAIEVFKRPDEIWGVRKNTNRRGEGSEFFNIYIKYYEDKPIVLLINNLGRVDSFYKWDKSLNNFESFRAGLLKKRN